MTRFALTVEYDGRPFVGWQRQSEGASVQGSIERALFEVTGETAAVHAAGRTDAGVHATAMRAHVDVAKPLAPFRLMEALNARLRPDPVAILDCRAVADDWHARFSCIQRAYVYRIVCRRAPLTHELGLAWRVPQELDAAAMAAAAARLVGRHDFTTFRSAHCQADSPLRTLDRLEVTRDGERIAIHAAARSFLHHQVRSMVGCLAMVGQGKKAPDDLADILAARDRSALWLNAPPDGLYFVGADYPG
ncbi:pseudouridine synthase [Sphingomonas sp. Leaf24]|uniref:tRNA pseudouridine(38-40) synthase TruA n=1 Tax=unclassified Sphingomonas TaxID=196159 RepID=UPI0006F924EB|nr:MULTISPECIES: tRNA pseudouridine(38-40) synthase TruA [unclassified Sphingomonas]KQM18645.1 pseudouridine synthase [Sphingomonas sp. Leaf5]KQM79636.1 pseudouridine synthase [Sphingomonas sp. Leaf22]KQM89406.1 pseudouridine synthase [Sphingomonas sp. Leaf24]